MRLLAEPDGAAGGMDPSERLLLAALELLAERGYRGATTKEIARRVGVNEVTLFRRFGSKEALLRAALSRFIPAGFLERLPAEEAPLEEGLKELLEAYLDLVTTPRTKVRGFSGFPPKAPSRPRKTLTPYRQASAMLLALPRVFVWSFTHRTTRWNPLLQVSRSTGNFVPKNIVPNPCPPVVDVGELSSLRSHVAARYASRDR
ncbi:MULTISPECIES: TetR/AcrR family transcriptional regulator [Thermus]|uniref:TetR/AcrR family transcriptional regulator n=1 Tax=Thermus TaxID=270 RepID=UPI001EFACF36|nr:MULTISPECIES: helix-turn-helix domain-containing protein [Thermus]ULR40773.1 TetR/AcrR family transcriptional regulator [Thermus sp. NEB1569]